MWLKTCLKRKTVRKARVHVLHTNNYIMLGYYEIILFN